jgi:phosphoenolpyruvate synthase/pyruvate phosphate dikinase
MTATPAAGSRASELDGWICPLSELRLADRARVGGKSAVLGELMAGGLPVLPGVAVAAAAYDAALEEPELREVADDFWSDADPAAADRLSDEIAERLRQAPTLASLASAVGAMLDRQQIHDDVIVRSSATAEDGHDRSFAGQFLSLRAARDPDGLASAIADVWASATAPHVPRYLSHLGGEGEGDGEQIRVAMGVLVQPHQSFDNAGVLFTQHPTVRLRDWALVEFLDVSPDRIVGGEVTPHRVRLRLSDGRLLWEHRAQSATTLHEDTAAALAQYARESAARLAADIDMEWGVVDDRAVVLQVRPATVSPW